MTPSTPSATPIAWTFEARATDSRAVSRTTVTAPTWFAARAAACVLLGAGPKEVRVVADGAAPSASEEPAT